VSVTGADDDADSGPRTDSRAEREAVSREGPGAATAPNFAGSTREETPTEVGYRQIITLVGIVVLAVGSVAFDLDVGFLALAIAAVLRLLAPRAEDAVGAVSWSTVLLICGVITYVGVLQAAGTIEYVSNGITAIGSALVAALLLCYLGGVLSAFASSVGILGVAIPLAVPFLQQGEVSAIGMVAALAVATTIVDVSPFSSNGALILANAPGDVDRNRFYRQMLAYAGVVVVVGPLLAWLLLVVPGWL
jgi:di/tricarboxylate transporter